MAGTRKAKPQVEETTVEQVADLEKTVALPLEEETQPNTPAEAETKKPEGIFKRVNIDSGFYQMNAGMLKGLSTENPDWIVELTIAGERCYIISAETYDKNM
jgi:hypothetical protein